MNRATSPQRTRSGVGPFRPLKSRLLSGLIAASLVILTSGCQSALTFPTAKFDNTDPSLKTVGHLTKPAGNGPFPAVVLLHSCAGFTSHVASDWPSYLTKQGFAVLAVDTFGSRGAGTCPNRVSNGDFVRDAFGALDYLVNQPYIDPNHVAVMGFSQGAIAIDEMLPPWAPNRAGRPNFKAAVLMYGSCANAAIKEPNIPHVLAVVGEKDRFATSCKFAATNSAVELHVIPGAFHSFDAVESSGRTDPYGNYMQYSGSATEAAQTYTRAFLRKYLEDE